MNNITPSLWEPSADATTLRARADLLARIRTFFQQRGVMEVETPLLSHAGNSDPGIAQFSTHEHDLWLRTSPEYAMKRLLAAGSADIFELGRVFRRGEAGHHHNLEFTILEWYRQGWSYHQLMDEVAALVRHCMPGVASLESRVRYRDLLLTHTGIDPMEATDQDLEKYIGSRGFEVPKLDRNGMLDLIISHFIQPQMQENKLNFVFDYPAEQAALARVRPDTPPVAERFELFLGRVELANGYQELRDWAEQRRRFELENHLRQHRGEAPVPLDERFLSALQSGLPSCAGVALGVDRLLMAIQGASSMSQVLAFPADRA